MTALIIIVDYSFLCFFSFQIFFAVLSSFFQVFVNVQAAIFVSYTFFFDDINKYTLRVDFDILDFVGGVIPINIVPIVYVTFKLIFDKICFFNFR